MPHKWISRFPLITLYKSHYMLAFLNKRNINLCKKYSISKYTRFYGSFATNYEVCFVQDFLQVKFRTIGYHQNMLFPSQTDTF